MAMMTSLPPIASWQKVPRYSNIPPLNLVDESDEKLKPSDSKLANIVNKQQKALEMIQNLLYKSDDLLGEELNRTQTLTDKLQRL